MSHVMSTKNISAEMVIRTFLVSRPAACVGRDHLNSVPVLSRLPFTPCSRMCERCRRSGGGGA